jgi:hypothetical protein
MSTDEELELLSSGRRQVLRALRVLTKYQKWGSEVEADDEDQKD